MSGDSERHEKSQRPPRMRLIYHPLSPFARIAYIVAIERHLAEFISFQKVVVAPVHYEGWSTHNELVGKYNPSNKIPCLLVDPDSSDPQAIFDSRVICEYFDSFSSEYQMQLQVDSDQDQASRTTFFANKTTLAAVNGAIDAEILVIYEERLRADKGILYPEWIDGMRQKVFRGIDYLDMAVQRGQLRFRREHESINTGEAAAAVFLAFLDSRALDWRTGRHGLAEWFDQTWINRPSFTNTDPAKDWEPGVPGPQRSRI